MSFEVGRLSAALTLEGVPEFHQGLDDAGRKLTDTGQKGSSFGRAGEAAIRAAAGATTTLTAAAAGYLTILTKQGVAYNSMQQNSRAALKVLLGGTEQANAQMDKLDDFARNSPFSKSVFIQAQQQLIGFGMEAGKVVPTLDAIQQGVAAMGGSNEQISEVVNILANVQSTGKITAETLNQLGYRGIDAATLMGDAMGKSAAQMREDISAGAIGGAEAIDILVDAMQTRFGGAADGVKEQWSGAVDRIKAAQRDIGAHIAEPFVSAEGGGMAVMWGNQVADVLRAIEKQAVPVMGILTQRSMPFFAELTQGLDSAKQAIQRWDADTLNVQLDKLANHAPAIGAVAGALLALGTSVGPLGKLFSTMGLTMNPVLAAFVGLAAASPEVRDALSGLMQAGTPLIGIVTELATVLSGVLNSALPVVAGGIDVVAGALKIVIGLFDAIPTPILLGAAAFLAFHQSTTDLAGPLGKASDAIQRFAEQSAVQAALGNTSRGVGMLSTASMRAKGALGSLGGAMKTAFVGNPVGMALTVISTAVGIWGAAAAASAQKVENHKNAVAELKGQLDQTTGALTEAAEATAKGSLEDTRAKHLAEEMGIAYSDVEKAMLGNADAQERVTEGMNRHWEENAVTLDKSKDALNGYSPSAVNARNRVSELNEIVGEQSSILSDAQNEIRATAAETEAAAQAMGEAGRNSAMLNDALQVLSDVSKDANERLAALQQALNLLNGGSTSSAEAELAHAKALNNLKDALDVTVEGGGSLVEMLNKSNGELDLNSNQATRLGDVLKQLNTDTQAQALAAFDAAKETEGLSGATEAARDVMVSGRADAIAQAEALGLSAEAASNLVNNYMAMPDEVSTALALSGADEATTLAATVLAQMQELEAGGQVEIPVAAEGADEAKQKLEELGYLVEEDPNGLVYHVTTEGADKAQEDLLGLAGIEFEPRLFKVTAEVGTTLADMEGVEAVKLNDKEMLVMGKTEDAQKQIQALIDKEIPGKDVTVTAADESFWNSWRAIQQEPNFEKTVTIQEQIIRSGGGKKFTGDVVTRNFVAGGFPSGMYRGVNGGIPKQGIDGTQHLFAEAHLGVPWEAYLSGHPAYRERNIGLALEALQRLAFPVVPANQVYGTRAFAQGDVLARRTTTSAPQSRPQPERHERRRGRDRGAPLVGTVNLGVSAKSSDLQNLKNTLDDLDRRG